MKKALLYGFAATVAVVLGVGIMLFPLWTYFRSYGEEGPIAFTDSTPYIKPMTSSENWQEYKTARTESIPSMGDSGVQPQSESADASLQMFAIGFIVALVAYVFVRRRSSRPTYLPSVGFPHY